MALPKSLLPLDALTDLPGQHFNVIVLFNALDHIEERVSFLKTLNARYQPRLFLVRVPVFERDWRVPLKREIGVDYRLDPTHYIEYTNEEFEQEIYAAGLKIEAAKVNWSEIWEVVKQCFASKLGIA